MRKWLKWIAGIAAVSLVAAIGVFTWFVWWPVHTIPALEPVSEYVWLDQGWGTTQDSPLRERYENFVLKRLYSPKSGPDPFERPAAYVTKFLLHALESNNPKPRYYITVPTHVAGILKRLLSTRLQDWLLAR